MAFSSSLINRRKLGCSTNGTVAGVNVDLRPKTTNPNTSTTDAEAKIRDWQRRKDAGEESPSPDKTLGECDSLEGQLLRQTVDMLRRAAAAAAPERETLLREAGQLEIRLMVLLEANGLRLTAKRIADELRTERAKATGG